MHEFTIFHIFIHICESPHTFAMALSKLDRLMLRLGLELGHFLSLIPGIYQLQNYSMYIQTVAYS